MEKKFAAILIVLLLCLTACGGAADYRAPKGFNSSSEHFDNERFRDYTDYCEYYYSAGAAESFKKNTYYTPVTEAEMAVLKEFLDNFSAWIVYRDGHETWYTFCPETQMSTDDYFFLDTTRSDSRFGDYDLGYYDAGTATLYYFHSNT